MWARSPGPAARRASRGRVARQQPGRRDRGDQVGHRRHHSLTTATTSCAARLWDNVADRRRGRGHVAQRHGTAAARCRPRTASSVRRPDQCRRRPSPRSDGERQLPRTRSDVGQRRDRRRGSVTFVNGAGPAASAVVSAVNSLVGTHPDDAVGLHRPADPAEWQLRGLLTRPGTTAPILQAGAITWGNGTTGRVRRGQRGQQLHRFHCRRPARWLRREGIVDQGNYVFLSPTLGQRRHGRRRCGHARQPATGGSGRSARRTVLSGRRRTTASDPSA